jgi:hypothetical protein
VLDPAGDLAQTPLTMLLQAFAADRRTGALTVTHPSAGSVRLWLRSGDAVLAERRDGNGVPRPALLHRLRTAGLLDTHEAAALGNVSGSSAAGSSTLGSPVDGVLDAGVPGPRRLAPHVTELLLDAVTEAANWTTGSWVLDPMAPVPLLTPVPTGTLLADVSERVTEFGSPATLADAAAAVPVLAMVRANEGFELATEAWAIVALADGVRTVGQIAAACGLTVAEAVGIVAALSAEDIVRCGPTPAARPVVVPAPRRAPEQAVLLPLVDDLQVILSPPVQRPLPPLDDMRTDTAAFLREFSGLIDEAGTGTRNAGTAPEPATAPDRTPGDRRTGLDRRTPSERRATDADGKPARRRLFGR